MTWSSLIIEKNDSFQTNQPILYMGFRGGWNKDTFLVVNSNVADKYIYSAQPNQ